MKRNDRFWCWWLCRYLIYIRKIGDLHLFEDFGDCRFLLTEDEVAKLTECRLGTEKPEP